MASVNSDTSNQALAPPGTLATGVRIHERLFSLEDKTA